MDRDEIRIISRLARRPLLAAAAIVALALSWPPAFGYLLKTRQAALSALEARQGEKRARDERLARQVADLERLGQRYRQWQARGLIGAADRPAWFEALTALAGQGAAVELEEARPVEGIDGAFLHPATIKLDGVVEPEALELAGRLTALSPVPWRLTALRLEGRGENGLKAALEGELLHLDPSRVEKLDLTQASIDATMK